ncbi:MAG: hypothetical protein ABIU97_10460, partial [Dehalococcoidia bacterium]
LVDKLSDERDAKYIRFKAGLGAAIHRFQVGDLIKARALTRELTEFAHESGSARALSFAHLAEAGIAANSGDIQRAVAELQRGRDAAVDPFYRCLAELYLGGGLVAVGNLDAARAVVEPGLRFSEEHAFLQGVLLHRLNQATLLLAEGELTRGMNQLLAVKQEMGKLGFSAEFQATMTQARVYAQIATGGATASIGSAIGTMVRNPGFVWGHARKASQTARDLLADLSENLSPDNEGARFNIEFEFGKLLIKRKERDEARKHLEKAISFLQPLGDTQGMRDARALLATLEPK